ncbi:MAG TPA: 2,3-bisphosphoglycerate-independent phosphoglycerate mutase [Candidatus Dormibacteraeota bacterium]|nr:2,3-bisphosphoglycerate-independent phosphoglycerate mutase [Candidatus Dormibacteraeota bacterium]
MLVILDGFGIGGDPAADAIAAAPMPAWRDLLAHWPHARLEASGEAVGLPPGQMGNSEVGHLNLGAGRPVLQDLPRIDAAIADGSFDGNGPLLAACDRAARPGARLHLVSLLGPGGVHANDRHLVALAALATSRGARDLVVHGLLDGRDTPPRSALGFVRDLEARLARESPGTRLATLGGRYYAMDRDRRWERTARGWAAIVRGEGLRAPSAVAAVEAGYERGEDDEFLQPTVIEGVEGRVRDGDTVITCNFRADRMRQLVHAFVDGDEFEGFDRGSRPRDLAILTMTEYESGLPVEVAFPPLVVTSLAERLAQLGWRQFHVAETEKYAHVTYFFNGGVEAAWPGEERHLVPSQKVATYDLRPEMSAAGVTDALVDAIRGDRYDFIVANYANADMVGHTGRWEATVAALAFLDGCLARVAEATLERDRAGRAAGGAGAILCITADHGNADELRDAAGRPVTAHSLNPVPILFAGSAMAGARVRDGVLADVAPTLLALAGEPPVTGMTGHDLLER